jgi:hypothetical protein
MILLAKIGVGCLSAALVGGAMISSQGFIRVKVHEKQADGTNVSLIVPAAIVPIALKFVPAQHLADASVNLRPYVGAIDAAIPELEDCPDGVLVEVTDPEEHVIIAKVGDSILVDVNDRDDTVHVAVPLRTAQSSIHEIAASGGPI